jgi:hypothetical protein
MVREFSFVHTMDPREAGKLGGRPSTAAAARSAAARAVASGSQRTLNFSGNVALSGTFKGTVNPAMAGFQPYLHRRLRRRRRRARRRGDGLDEPADAADGAAA